VIPAQSEDLAKLIEIMVGGTYIFYDEWREHGENDEIDCVREGKAVLWELLPVTP